MHFDESTQHCFQIPQLLLFLKTLFESYITEVTSIFAPLDLWTIIFLFNTLLNLISFLLDTIINSPTIVLVYLTIDFLLSLGNTWKHDLTKTVNHCIAISIPSSSACKD